MERGLRYTILFIVGFFVVAVLWRLFFDQVIGVTARQKERGRNLREVQIIADRMESHFKTNKVFPKTMQEIADTPSYGPAVRSAETLQTTYTLASGWAEQEMTKGKANVIVVFENLRYVGKECGGFVVYASPRNVRWLEEARYQQEWKQVFGTNCIPRR